MGTEQSAPKRKTWGKRLLIIGWRVVVSLVVVLALARAAWNMSGSNQWELFRDKNGVRVDTLKQPGADMIRVRGIVQVRSTLASLVAWILEPDTCKDIDCYELKILDQVDHQIVYSTFRFDAPPFKTREFVVREHAHQIPQTKEVWVELAAAPERLPPNDCCFRVTTMSNTWRLTPVANGVVEVEYTTNMNEGGFVPDLVLNRDRPRWIYSELSKLQGYLNKPRWRNAKVDSIEEPVAIGSADHPN
jgi:hypothetical protein